MIMSSCSDIESLEGNFQEKSPGGNSNKVKMRYFLSTVGEFLSKGCV